MKNFLKKDSGISGIDIITSIGIIMIFSTVITVVYTNLTASNVKIQRTQIATNYAVALMEKVDKLYYDEVSEEELKENMNFSNKYIVNVNVEEQKSKKKVTIEISFNVGRSSTETIKMEKMKEKEILISLNKPVLEEDMVPAKYVGSELIKTNIDDSEWYDYSNKKWAYAVLNNNSEMIYVWIPRYAFSDNDIKFLYGKGNRFVNNKGNLETLSSEYSIVGNFINKEGIWVEETEIEANSVSEKMISLVK